MAYVILFRFLNYIYLPTVVVVVVVAEAVVRVSRRASITASMPTAKISPAPREAKMHFLLPHIETNMLTECVLVGYLFVEYE